uniref:Uncharacterized protein n=1 Tax=Cyclophora tenuis TaxID=216820 RepID=A0A7S1D8F6_CYCTE
MSTTQQANKRTNEVKPTNKPTNKRINFPTKESMRDVESDKQPLNNPYSLPRDDEMSPNHPVNVIYRVGVLGGSLYFLHTWSVYDTILHSPNVRHEWFKIGLAASIALLAVKGYVEMYEGKLNKKTVNYNNFRQSTHAIMLLFTMATIAFYVAIWPAFGWQSVPIMTILGYGILLQFALLVPTYVQNIVGFVLMTFFLQQYA